MLKESKRRRKFRFNKGFFKRLINVYWDQDSKRFIFEMETRENGSNEVVKKSIKVPLVHLFDDFKFNFKYKEK